MNVYLFYDTANTDNTSQYTDAYEYWETQSSFTFTITHNTDHYTISHTDGGFMGVCIPTATTSWDNYVFSAEILANGSNTDYGGGLGIIKQENVGTGVGLVQPNSTTGKHTYLQNLNNRNGTVLSQTVTSNYVVGDYHTHRLTKQGTILTYEILHEDTIIFTNTITINSTQATECVPCLTVGRWDTSNFKNIKVKPL